MKRKQFSEEEIIAILKGGEAGATGKDGCRRHGISENTFCKWKAKYRGMNVLEAKRLRELEARRNPLPNSFAVPWMGL
jgi:putative transposase